MINEARNDLVADLEPLDIPVYSTYQDKVPALPCVTVVPPRENNFIEPGQQLQTYRINWDLIVMVEFNESSASAQLQMESILENILALDSDWLVAPTINPFNQVVDQNVSYLESIINVSKITQV
jgi:hypothetical protein